MSTNSTETLDTLREELLALRKQVESLAQTAKEKTQKQAPAANPEETFEKYQKLAAENLQRALDAGGSGLESVNERIRQNPLGSLLLAFGVGYVLSLVFRQGK